MKKIWRSLIRYFKETDKILLLLCFICSAVSVLLMCGIHNSGMATIRAVQMQIITSLLGLAAAMIISSFDYRFLSKLWKLYYPVCIGLVILTYFFGEQRVESVDDKAWLPIPFVGINFQPSELLKIAFILTFALHLEKVGDGIKELKHLVFLCIHGAIPCLLIHLQGDDGTALIFLFIFLSMLFSAGIQWRYIVIAGSALIIAATKNFVYWRCSFRILIQTGFYTNSITPRSPLGPAAVSARDCLSASMCMCRKSITILFFPLSVNPWALWAVCR